ncbi:Transmembrane 4 L6 family member 20 [Galemys pyrenaicus]|uniref:Transmembrane 4 L6 family member 20 n=1 Tax=Galemys pyrenaicus TaxID=202257 RepID=A0A8J6B8V7_GALPY|nr:Transmembrane 4 L6 family member 20 [Galemys pyrenaicus]
MRTPGPTDRQNEPGEPTGPTQQQQQQQQQRESKKKQPRGLLGKGTGHPLPQGPVGLSARPGYQGAASDKPANTPDKGETQNSAGRRDQVLPEKGYGTDDTSPPFLGYVLLQSPRFLQAGLSREAAKGPWQAVIKGTGGHRRQENSVRARFSLELDMAAPEAWTWTVASGPLSASRGSHQTEILRDLPAGGPEGDTETFCPEGPSRESKLKTRSQLWRRNGAPRPPTDRLKEEEEPAKARAAAPSAQAGMDGVCPMPVLSRVRHRVCQTETMTCCEGWTSCNGVSLLVLLLLGIILNVIPLAVEFVHHGEFSKNPISCFEWWFPGIIGAGALAIPATTISLAARKRGCCNNRVGMFLSSLLNVLTILGAAYCMWVSLCALAEGPLICNPQVGRNASCEFSFKKLSEFDPESFSLDWFFSDSCSSPTGSNNQTNVTGSIWDNDKWDLDSKENREKVIHISVFLGLLLVGILELLFALSQIAIGFCGCLCGVSRRRERYV